MRLLAHDRRQNLFIFALSSARALVQSAALSASQHRIPGGMTLEEFMHRRVTIHLAVLLALAGLSAPAWTQPPLSLQNIRSKGRAAVAEQPRAAAPLAPPAIVTLAEKMQQVASVASTSGQKALAAPQPFDLRRQAASNPAAVEAARLGLEIHWDEDNGTPTFVSVSAAAQQRILSKTAAAARAAHIAKTFIADHRALFRLANPEEELQIAEEHVDRLGKQHVRFIQTLQGVPVWGKDLVAHVEADGRLYALNARHAPTPTNLKLPAAQLTAAQAVAIAQQHLAQRTEITVLSAGEKKMLSYDGPQAAQYLWTAPASQQPRLIWHVEIRPNLQDDWYYFIDAASGAILECYNNTRFDGPRTAAATDLNGKTQTVHSYQVGNAYIMVDASRPIWQQHQPDLINDPRGALVTLDLRNKDLNPQATLYHVVSNDNTWPDAVAVSAHSIMGTVFSYYYNTHGRLAIDGQGSSMISIIHRTLNGQPLDNASWNGAAMSYGDGNVRFKPLAGALDVAGHEMTHGVVSHTVKLEYKFQSGALDESLADVFGMMVDREDWRMGEDIVKPGEYPSGALRDLSDPHNGGSRYGDRGWQPAHMNEFVNLNIDSDNGGVHVNSGIPNRAAYLITNALGHERTEKIYYRVMEARYLNAQSNFVDMRLAAVQAATDLYGSQSAEVNAVKSAFDAVGIFDGTGAQPPQDLPAVQGEQWIATVNADAANTSLFLVRPEVNSPQDIVQLTTTQVYLNTANPVTVSDNGALLYFVDKETNIRVIRSDGLGEEVITNLPGWRSVAISPQGTKLAATRVEIDTTIYIFDLVNPAASFGLRLRTPATGQGDQMNTTVMADALDWSSDGQFLVYDAFNSVPQGGGKAREYWEVNLLDVAHAVTVRLFPPQPDGISFANPSFAQNNDGYIVFDLLDYNAGSVKIMVANLFTGEIVMIEDNGNSVGYPRFSTSDERLVYNASKMVRPRCARCRWRAIAWARPALRNFTSTAACCPCGSPSAPGRPGWKIIPPRCRRGLCWIRIFPILSTLKPRFATNCRSRAGSRWPCMILPAVWWRSLNTAGAVRANTASTGRVAMATAACWRAESISTACTRPALTASLLR